MIITPSLFVTAVSGLIRIGSGFRDMFTDEAQKRAIFVNTLDLRAFLDAYASTGASAMQDLALNWAYFAETRAIDLAPGGRFDLLFTQQSVANGSVPIPNQAISHTPEFKAQLHAALDGFAIDCEKYLPDQLRAKLQAQAVSDPRVPFLYEDWFREGGPKTGWRRFGLILADTALDVIGANPQMMGLSDKAEKLLGALAPSIGTVVKTELLDQESDEDQHSFGERLIATFMRGAMSVVTEHPDLVTTEDRWKPVVQSILPPLVDAMGDENGAPTFIAQRRLRDLMKGPVLHGALNAINDNADAFLKGGAQSDKAVGAVSRAILSDLVKDGQDHTALNLQKYFSTDGVIQIYNTTLKTAAARPDLFIHGDNDEVNAARNLLSGVTGALTQADMPAPFGAQHGLGPDIINVMFDVAQDYTGLRIDAELADGGGFNPAWADVCSSLATDLFSGLREGVLNKQKPDIFARIFTRDQALDLVRTMATHIASTPQMLTGKDGNPEVRNIAVAVAEVVASDDMQLLGAEDWRKLISVMLDAASKNPGVLFSLDETNDVSNQLGVALVTHVFSRASANMAVAGRAPGRVLFGETLREALVATVQAASTNLASSFTTTGVDGERSHVNALGDFVDQLNVYAAQTDDPSLAMTADEWLHVYKFFVAHILENGPGAVAQIRPEHIKAVLRDEDVNLGAPA